MTDNAMTTPPDDLTVLRALEAAAIPQPWNLQPDGQVWCDDHPIADITEGEWGDTAIDITTGKRVLVHHWGTVAPEAAHANAALIVAMRNALPDLLDRIEQQAEAVATAAIDLFSEALRAVSAEMRADSDDVADALLGVVEGIDERREKMVRDICARAALNKDPSDGI